MASRKPKRAPKAKPAPKPIAKKAAPRASKKTKAKAPTKKPRGSVKEPVTKKSVAKKPVAKAAPKPLAKSAPKPVAKAAPKPVAKKAATPARARNARSTPARDARSALAQKRAIKETLEPVAKGTEVVDAYMRDVDHPFKAEMAAVRQIILAASPKISERIKWNAPSFFYKEDLGAFNPRATEYAHLILLFPGGSGMQADGGLLEGEHKDRREVKFHGMEDVTAKKPSLEKLIKRWVALRDR